MSTAWTDWWPSWWMAPWLLAPFVSIFRVMLCICAARVTQLLQIDTILFIAAIRAKLSNWSNVSRVPWVWSTYHSFKPLDLCSGIIAEKPEDAGLNLSKLKQAMPLHTVQANEFPQKRLGPLISSKAITAQTTGSPLKRRPKAWQTKEPENQAWKTQHNQAMPTANNCA